MVSTNALEGNMLDMEAYAVYSESQCQCWPQAEFGQLSKEQTRYGLGAMGSLNFILIVIGCHWLILKRT